MALAVHQFSVVDDDGDVVPNASIEVRQEITGSPIAVLFSDRAGVFSLGNPFNADGEGFAQFFVAGGAYRVTATSGAFSRVWRYVAVGTAAESDIEDFVSGAGTVVDQSIIRAFGPTGTSLQGSNVLLDDSGNMFFPEGTRLEWQTGSPAAADVAITHSLNALAFSGAANGYTFDNALEITPPTATTTRGIDVIQVGPTSGTDPQSTVYFNRIDINAAGTHADSEGDIIGLGVSMGLGGSNAAGQHIALFGQTVVNAATSDTPEPFLKVYVGVTGIAQGSVNDGGTGTGNSTDAKGYVLGMNAFSILANGATNYLHCTPMEMLTSVRTGASVRTHVGARIVQYFDHAVSGANLDAGLQFINQTGAVGWEDYGIIFDTTSDDAGTLFKASATVIGVTGTPTVTHGIDFQTVTFTGAAFRSNGFFVNGGGEIFGPLLGGGLNASSSLTLKSTGGVGTTDFIDFLVGNNGGTRAARIVNGGQIIVGHTAAIQVNSEAGSAFTPQLETHATGAGATGSITRWSADANPGRFAIAKSRGASIGTRGAVAASDVLGLILFNGDDGTNFLPGAYIRASVDGTPGANDMPTQLSFAVTADGAATPTQWMSLRQNGILESAGGFSFLNATAPAAGGNAAHGIKYSSTADLGIYFGTGAPNFTANRGSLYVNTTATTAATRLYINNASGSGNSWTAFTAAA